MTSAFYLAMNMPLRQMPAIDARTIRTRPFCIPYRVNLDHIGDSHDIYVRIFERPPLSGERHHVLEKRKGSISYRLDDTLPDIKKVDSRRDLT